MTGEIEADAAAKQLATKLSERLTAPPQLVLYLAKGYGPRSSSVGPLLQENFGESAIVVGCSSEGGVLAEGREVQEETFALGALAISSPSLRAYPFHAGELDQLPPLGRGGKWGSQDEPSTALAMAMLPDTRGDPQSWVGMLDNVLAGKSKKPPVVVGGLPVGGNAFVDGERELSGGFGVVLRGLAGADPVVSPGAEPFGPFLEITGVAQEHVITEINGQSPLKILMPLMHGPEVPCLGHSMAGIFVDPSPEYSQEDGPSALLAAAALGARPCCLVRPLHAFTPEGHLVLSPLTEHMPYSKGMKLQLHCFSRETALSDLRARAETDMALHEGRPPDAAVLVFCGARGVSFYQEEGVESAILREVWGRDVPAVGFFAGGEFGPVGLRTYLHSYTTSCLFLRLRD